MIKNWQKWFVCIFAAIFVSVFFVYDAMFVQANKVTYDPTVNADSTLPEPEAPVIEVTPVTPEEEQPEEEEEEITLPTYTNGYTCLNDALQRLQNEQYYVWSYSSSGTSLGVEQKIKGAKYFSGTNFGSEVFAYCETSLGKRFYERITSTDMQTFRYIKTTDIDSSYNYSLAGATDKTLSSSELTNMVGPFRTKILSLVPVKGVDKQAKFDRTSNKNYYICSFVFNVDKLNADYLNDIKREADASKVTHSYLQISYYISKTTGQLEKLEHSEAYEMNVGISLNVTYKLTANLTIYKQPFEIKF